MLAYQPFKNPMKREAKSKTQKKRDLVTFETTLGKDIIRIQGHLSFLKPIFLDVVWGFYILK